MSRKKNTRVQRFSIHIPGVSFQLMCVLLVWAAIQTQHNLLFWVCGLMIAAIVVSVCLSWTQIAGLRVRRLDPQHAAVGEALVVRYRFHNRLWGLPLFSLVCQEISLRADNSGRDRRSAQRSTAAEHRVAALKRGIAWNTMMAPARAWVMHLSARDSAHAEAVFWPSRRGRVRFDRLRVTTSFPFGLIKRSVTITQPHTTLVFPRLYNLRHGLLRSVLASGPDGMRVSNRPGHGDDYYGIREFRDGDSLRQISWKHSARLDELVSIERSRPSPPKLRIVLNLTRPTKELRIDSDSLEARRELEEKAISLAASIIYQADAEGFEVGLWVPGTALPDLPVRGNRWHMSKLMAALALINLDSDRSSAVIAPRSLTGERAGVIAVHPDRVEPDIIPDEAWHVPATQLAEITTGPRGWDPIRIKNVTDIVDAVVTGASSVSESTNGAATAAEVAA